MKLLPTHSTGVAVALFVLIHAHEHSIGVVHALAQRNVRCDDIEPLTCKLESNLSKQFPCKDGEILARQLGCFACVDETTCLRKIFLLGDAKGLKATATDPANVVTAAVTPVKAVAGSAQTHVATPAKAATAAKVSTSGKVSAFTATNAESVKSSPTAAWIPETLGESLPATAKKQKTDEEKKRSTVDEKTRVSELSLPFIPDALSVAESAQFNGVDVSSDPETVSSWLFMAPAMLALVSVGAAVRSRVQHKRGETFERVADRDDEINPFCDSVQNPQDDDDTKSIEFAARFTVASDDDDDSGHENHNEGGSLDAGAGGEVVDDGTATDDSGFAIVVSSS